MPPLRGKLGAAGALGRLHQRRNGAPRVAGLRRVDAGEPEHHGRVEHVAGAVADLVRHAGKRREIAVAGAVDEDPRTHGGASRLGLDHQRINVVAFLDDAAGEGMEQERDAAPEQHLVGRAFVGRGVVGLRHGAAEDRVRRVEAVEAARRASSSSATPCTTWRTSPCTLAWSPQKLVTPAAVPMPPRKP